MLDNPTPIVRPVQQKFRRPTGNIDTDQIYQMIRSIKDPQHPYTLQQLDVVSPQQIWVSEDFRSIHIKFTPTVPHCSLSTLIGLSIRVKLLNFLPRSIKTTITVTQGTHAQQDQINKQLNDKQRVAAAMENPYLMEVVQSNLGDWD